MSKDRDAARPPADPAGASAPGVGNGPDTRESRRAAALRANLRRRKAADAPGEPGG